jgi:hypothetical protein
MSRDCLQWFRIMHVGVHAVWLSIARNLTRGIKEKGGGASEPWG